MMMASERGEVGLAAGIELLRGGASGLDAVEATRRAGAVAAVTGFPHPITIARAVCERLPQHLLLVGAGAERFAEEVGIERGPTLTDAARQRWREGLSAAGIEAATARFGPGERAYREQVLERLASMEVAP